ncbi:MAG: hypothetical protein A3F69_00090 [Acidobacteria bacterium RIFCSPLOWO2_12_FULL_66_10]|nr:MAG: hypothetical protein A3F69_00090 [Acidobacteria bacterium RIFCSPLOWO2_12_FULL_66_10]
MTATTSVPFSVRTEAPTRPPIWLIVSTGVLALTILALAVAETDLKAHYLIDQGEFISVFGLGFVLIAGAYLFRSKRLRVSLPLTFPWLLYPIVAQGDQIIDNLSINPMRAICHVLLAAIFATPVAVLVAGTRHLLARMSGRSLDRRGATRLAAVLMTAEIWLAYQFLGTLMVVTLVLMILGTVLYGLQPGAAPAEPAERRGRGERFACGVLLVGFALSLGTYVGYKNQPGAYQGSPSFFMDPSQKDANYRIDQIQVPPGAPAVPASPDVVREALIGYGRTLDRMLVGYHILDRNYTYDFHNALFVRHTPLLPNYRAAGLARVEEARRLRADADTRGAAARASLPDGDPLAALIDDLRAYVAFNFDRAPVLERLSGEFERTPAGLQHAAHLYEGESKYLGSGLSDIVTKYRAVVDAPALAPVTGEFVAIGRSIYEAYAHHVVGF